MGARPVRIASSVNLIRSGAVTVVGVVVAIGAQGFDGFKLPWWGRHQCFQLILIFRIHCFRAPASCFLGQPVLGSKLGQERVCAG
jgi:hypothetical protein